MGTEFAQFIEWRQYEQLPWHIIDTYYTHKQTLLFFKNLNHFYTDNKALWERDYDPSGFQWIDANNSQQSILSFIRYGNNPEDSLIFIINFTPTVYYDFHLGVPEVGHYQEVFNSDNSEFGGSGQHMDYKIPTISEGIHGFEQKIAIKIPPQGAIVFKLVDRDIR